MHLYDPSDYGHAGARLVVLDKPESIYYGSLPGGRPECELMTWVASWMPRDRAFVDVGAHCGTWALNFAPLVSRVFAFEAQRSTFYQLCGGIVLNDLHDKVTAHHIALSDVSGQATGLRIISRDGGGSSIVLDLPAHDTTPRFETVGVDKLGDYVGEGVGLIKIDVEGAEVKVVAGAESVLRRNNLPTMLIESWAPERGLAHATRRKELVAVLLAIGYRVVPIRGYDEMLLAERALT